MFGAKKIEERTVSTAGLYPSTTQANCNFFPKAKLEGERKEKHRRKDGRDTNVMIREPKIIYILLLQKGLLGFDSRRKKREQRNKNVPPMTIETGAC